VNLVYATFHQRTEINSFLGGLFDDLTVERIDIDVVEFTGPAFPERDRTEWYLALLCRKMARAMAFGAGGNPVEPASILRKRPMIVIRGTFNHPELIKPAMFKAAMRQLQAEGSRFEREPVTLLEMTIHHVTRAGILSASEMSERVRQLTPRCPVIVSDLPETYLLSRYLRRYSTEPIRFVMSVAAAAKVMHETFYQDLPGALLEGLGRLFAANVKLYVAPMSNADYISASRDVPGAIAIRPSAGGLVELDDLMPSAPGSYLLQYLRSAGQIVALEPLP
jgi:hypothetical protein